MKPVRIVIMAKMPESGMAKTRLIPALGAKGAAQLARLMLLRTIDTALAANIGLIECCVTPCHEDLSWSALKSVFDVNWSSQSPGDLGQRMANIASRIIAQGENILLIGTDCPSLTSSHLVRAAEWLEYGHACMIPVSDGGYCLLGLSRFDHTVFSEIAWSTDSVAAQTRSRIMQLGWNLAEIDQLHDIDEPDDLLFLPPEMLDGLVVTSA